MMLFDDKEKLNELKKKIRLQTYYYGFNVQDAKECMQWIFTKILEGRFKKSTTRQMVIEYMRTEFGSTRTKMYTNKRNIKKDTIQLKDVHRYQMTLKSEDFVYVDKLCTEIKDMNNQIIFKLKFKWGLTNDEIADLYCCTQATILIRLRKIIKELKKKNLTLV